MNSILLSKYFHRKVKKILGNNIVIREQWNVRIFILFCLMQSVWDYLSTRATASWYSPKLVGLHGFLPLPATFHSLTVSYSYPLIQNTLKLLISILKHCDACWFTSRGKLWQQRFYSIGVSESQNLQSIQIGWEVLFEQLNDKNSEEFWRW